MLRALGVGVFLTAYILVAGTPLLLHALLTGSVRRLYAAGVGGARLALRLAGIRVRAEGADKIPPGVCLFVCNHLSNVDPPAVVSAIPRRVALLAKKEVFRIPILAQALRIADFVAVDRADREAARASAEAGVAGLKRGVSYLVFPEGTRSPDGRLCAFKKGAFRMALQAGVPVVPVAVWGTEKVMPRGSLAIHPGEVHVRFGTPLEAAQYAENGGRDALRAAAHAAVAAMLPPELRPAAGGASGAGERLADAAS